MTNPGRWFSRVGEWLDDHMETIIGWIAIVAVLWCLFKYVL